VTSALDNQSWLLNVERSTANVALSLGLSRLRELIEVRPEQLLHIGDNLSAPGNGKNLPCRGNVFLHDGTARGFDFVDVRLPFMCVWSSWTEVKLPPNAASAGRGSASIRRAMLIIEIGEFGFM
jgi:hypothetical protein